MIKVRAPQACAAQAGAAQAGGSGTKRAHANLGDQEDSDDEYMEYDDEFEESDKEKEAPASLSNQKNSEA